MSAYDDAIIKSCVPGLSSLADEMAQQLRLTTHRQTGQLIESVYSTTDRLTGMSEVGYDETGRPNPHGYSYNQGSSDQEGDFAIQRTVLRKYKDRKGDGS